MQPRIAHPSGLPPTSAEIVVGRLLKGAKGPLPDFLARLVTSLHALVREARPTRMQWCDVIAFLTEVGHASDELRQEWVLLSDLLGVTALVEEINSQRPRGVTPNTARGAFYRADAARILQDRAPQALAAQAPDAALYGIALRERISLR